MSRIFYVISLLWGFLLFGQHTVTGIVYGSQQQPLEGAHIHLSDQSVNAQKDGTFQFRNVPQGKHKVFVTYVGYVRKDTLIVVTQAQDLVLRLQKDPVLLQEVAVKGNPISNKGLVVEAKVKTVELQRNAARSLAEVLAEIPGVSILRTGSTVAKPVIQGLHSSRVPVVVNGIRSEDQQWGVDHAPNFDSNTAGKISVIKGAGALQYGGDAIGGLILIEPHVFAKDTLSGSAVVSLHSNGRGGAVNAAVHRGNFCDWAWNVQTGMKYFGDREAPDYVLSNSGSREYSFSGDVKHIGKKVVWGATASFYQSQMAILTASHIGNVTDLYYAITSGQPYFVGDFGYRISNPKQEVRHIRGKLFLNYTLTDTESWNTQYEMQYNQRYEYDIRRGQARNTPSLDLTLTTHTVLSDYKKQTEKAVFKAGVMGQYQHNAASPDTGIRPLIPTYEKVDFGLYGVYQYAIAPKWTAEAGIRYDFSQMMAQKFYLKSRWNERNYSPQFDHFIVGDVGTQWNTRPEFLFHNLSASAGIRWNANARWDFLLSLGRAVRNPNPSELFSDGLHHATGMIELGDLNLTQEKAFKTALEINYRSTPFTLTATPYMNRIQDFMYLRPVGFETTIRGAFPVWEYQRTDALLLGLDWNAQVRWNAHWSYGVMGAMVYAQDQTTDTPIIDIPSLNFTQHIQFEYLQWHGLTTQLRCLWMTQQNRYPNTNIDASIVVDNQLVPVTVDVSTPPPGYVLWDWNAAITLVAKNKSEWVIGFGVQNIGNTRYRNYLNRQRFFADEMGRNIQVQLRYNF